jgi:hypothetical protein
MGNTRQIGQIHVPDLIRRKRCDQQKAKYKQEKQVQPHDSCNTRHERNTRSTNSVGESTGSARDIVPNKTKQARGTTTANTILMDSTHTKNECGFYVLSCSCSRARAVPQNVWRKIWKSIYLDWDAAFKDAILPILSCI